MKKVIILTILIGTILALFIYKITYHEEMTILALGDGLARGMTAYDVEGYGYNDYLRDYFEEKSILRDFIKDFATSDETSESLLKKINQNEKLSSTNLTIQQAINKAKIITLGIGMDELNNLKKIQSKNVDKYLENFEKIIKNIKIYNKNKLYVISLYPTKKLTNNLIKEINTSLEKIAIDNDCYFIDISEIDQKKEFYFNDKSYYLNYKGHKYISDLIIKIN